MISNKKLLAVLGIVLAITLVIGASIKSERSERKQAVARYVACLRDNYMQRDFCARQQGMSYIFLDQWLEDEGYSYGVDGYDLYLVEK